MLFADWERMRYVLSLKIKKNIPIRVSVNRKILTFTKLKHGIKLSRLWKIKKFWSSFRKLVDH